MCADTAKRIMFTEYLSLLPVSEGDVQWAALSLSICFQRKTKTRLHFIPPKYVFKVCSTFAIFKFLGNVLKLQCRMGRGF